MRLVGDPVSPWSLLDGAAAVYTVSSQMGFEAILAGHRPQVFGRPFYAGWGLTADRHAAPLPRRGRPLSRAQLFAGAMILYPVWYDPCRDRLCDLETVLAQFEAETRAWREDRRGWSAHGMRLWKRGHVQRFFGGQRRVVFDRPASGRPAMVWASARGRPRRTPPASRTGSCARAGSGPSSCRRCRWCSTISASITTRPARAGWSG